MQRCVTLLVMILALSTTFARATVYVITPEGTGDFATIQAAIDAAEDGDVIELTNGVFTGDGNREIDFLGRAITLRSQGGDPETCIIDCEGSAEESHHCLDFQNEEGEESIVRGITLTNGYAIGED